MANGIKIVVPNADFSNCAIGKIDPSAVKAPTISVVAGVVTISAQDATDIYYTLNGNNPTASSSKYTSAFNVVSGTTIKAVALGEDGTLSSVTTKEYSVIYTDAKYFMPLGENSTPTTGSLTVVKENATYSAGASFMSVGTGIVYQLDDADDVKAVAFDFKRASTPVSASGGFLFGVGAYDGTSGTGTAKNGMYFFFNAGTGELGGLEVHKSAGVHHDVTFSTVTVDVWHRFCAARIDNKLVLYIDGVKISDEYWMETLANNSYLIVGNAWRYRVDNGDRALIGSMRNFAVWTTTISESDMVKFSKM